jgi:hypothetical protein
LLLSPIHSVFSTLEFERSPIEGAEKPKEKK